MGPIRLRQAGATAPQMQLPLPTCLPVAECLCATNDNSHCVALDHDSRQGQIHPCFIGPHVGIGPDERLYGPSCTVVPLMSALEVQGALCPGLGCEGGSAGSRCAKIVELCPPKVVCGAFGSKD